MGEPEPLVLRGSDGRPDFQHDGSPYGSPGDNPHRPVSAGAPQGIETLTSELPFQNLIDVVHDGKTESLTHDEALAHILERSHENGILIGQGHDGTQMLLDRQAELFLLQEREQRKLATITVVGFALLGGAVLFAAHAAGQAAEAARPMAAAPAPTHSA